MRSAIIVILPTSAPSLRMAVKRSPRKLSLSSWLSSVSESDEVDHGDPTGAVPSHCSVSLVTSSRVPRSTRMDDHHPLDAESAGEICKILHPVHRGRLVAFLWRWKPIKRSGDVHMRCVSQVLADILKRGAEAGIVGGGLGHRVY